MMFGWGYRERAITPTDPAAYDGFVKSGDLPRHYPPFNAVIYSLENFLPLVDLHQGTYWRPKSASRLRRPAAGPLWKAAQMVPVGAYPRRMGTYAAAGGRALRLGASGLVFTR